MILAFTLMQISSNGLLSFGTLFTSYSPTSFPLSSVVVIAPFWDDIILTNTGIVRYGIVTSTCVINKVETFLKLNQNINLEIDWVFVTKWENVCPFGNSNCAQVSHHILYFKTFITIVFFIDKHI